MLFDLSGVMIVDTMVAHQIFKIVEALGLLGVKTILIGIRPEVAQTMIQLGIDFSKITDKSKSRASTSWFEFNHRYFRINVLIQFG